MRERVRMRVRVPARLGPIAFRLSSTPMRLLSLCLVLLPSLAFAGDSATPPEGPPWERDLLAAHAKALKAGVPVFCYFTKTY